MNAAKIFDGKPSRASVVDADSCSTLYIGNLHPGVTVSMLQEVCLYFGPVEQVKVIKNKVTGASVGYGFVKFADPRFADLALQYLHGKIFYGQELRVNWAFQSHQREDTSSHHHIFVGDIGQDVTDASLFSAFSVIGGCSDARVMWDHTTGRSKGYGFVSFRTKEVADRAIERMHGQYIGSRRVRCGWAQHKQDDGEAPLSYEALDQQDPSNTNVYVGNVSSETTEADLQRQFLGYGNVLEIKLHKKGGYGFVRMEKHQAAVHAILGMHGQVLHGKALKCSWGKNTSSGLQPVSHPHPYLHNPHAHNTGMPMMMQPMMATMPTMVGLPHPMMGGQGPMHSSQMLPGAMGSMLVPGQQSAAVMQHLGRGAHSQQLGVDPHAMFYGSGMYFGP